MESKEQVYKTQIKKKMEELAQICYRNNMPCFFVVAVGDRQKTKKNDFEDVHDKLELRSVTYVPETLYCETKDTVFSDFVNVMNGFTTVPPGDKSQFSLDADDLILPPDIDGSF